MGAASVWAWIFAPASAMTVIITLKMKLVRFSTRPPDNFGVVITAALYEGGNPAAKQSKVLQESTSEICGKQEIIP